MTESYELLGEHWSIYCKVKVFVKKPICQIKNT